MIITLEEYRALKCYNKNREWMFSKVQMSSDEILPYSVQKKYENLLSQISRIDKDLYKFCIVSLGNEQEERIEAIKETIDSIITKYVEQLEQTIKQDLESGKIQPLEILDSLDEGVKRSYLSQNQFYNPSYELWFYEDRTTYKNKPDFLYLSKENQKFLNLSLIAATYNNNTIIYKAKRLFKKILTLLK